MNNLFDFLDKLVSEYSFFSRSFSNIAASNIIGETLQRVTDPLKNVAAVKASLVDSETRALFTWTDFDAFRIDQLSIWVKLELREFSDYFTQRLVLAAYDAPLAESHA